MRYIYISITVNNQVENLLKSFDSASAEISKSLEKSLNQAYSSQIAPIINKLQIPGISMLPTSKTNPSSFVVKQFNDKTKAIHNSINQELKSGSTQSSKLLNTMNEVTRLGTDLDATVDSAIDSLSNEITRYSNGFVKPEYLNKIVPSIKSIIHQSLGPQKDQINNIMKKYHIDTQIDDIKKSIQPTDIKKSIQSGGDMYYNKYIKYKTKYLYLKGTNKA
jgi:predicted nuclease of restriction endonuclease-like RecB superfamily